jgi:hypothetical protein
MELLAGEGDLLLTQLGDPPRSGFAAAGQLVRQYGFGVHVEPSPYGGVRAVVYIPGDPLLTVLDESAQPMSVMAPLPHRSGMTERSASALPTGAAPSAAPSSSGQPAPAPATPAAPAAPAAPAVHASYDAPAAEGELPRRRRRKPVSEAEQTPRTEPLPPRSPEETGSRWAALQRGTESGRAAAQSEPPRSPEGNAQS